MPTLFRLLLLVALVVSVALPATAQGEVELLKPCGGPLTTVGYDDLSTQIATPAVPLASATTVAHIIDLAGEPVGSTARVDVTVSWDDPVSDFDIDVNGTASAGFTVLSGPQETVNLGTLKHCSVITTEVANFSGSPLAAITLDISAR